MGSKVRGSGSGRRSDLVRGLPSMDLQRGDLEKAGRRRRFGEDGGAKALGSGGAPFHSSLSPAALGRGDGAALARREVVARAPILGQLKGRGGPSAGCPYSFYSACVYKSKQLTLMTRTEETTPLLCCIIGDAGFQYSSPSVEVRFGDACFSTRVSDYSI